MNEFGREVKKTCVDLGLTQHYIAQKAGLSDNGLSNSLSRDNISLTKMKEIASAMGCELQIKLVPKNK